MHFQGSAFASCGKVTKSWHKIRKKVRKLENQRKMHFQAPPVTAHLVAGSNSQKLTRACGKPLKVTKGPRNDPKNHRPVKPNTHRAHQRAQVLYPPNLGFVPKTFGFVPKSSKHTTVVKNVHCLRTWFYTWKHWLCTWNVWFCAMSDRFARCGVGSLGLGRLVGLELLRRFSVWGRAEIC